MRTVCVIYCFMFKVKLKKRILLIVLVCLFVIVGHYLGFGRYSERYVMYVLSPVEKIFTGTAEGIADKISFYFSKNDYRQKNNELRERIIELQKENANLKMIMMEKEIVKDELEFNQSKGYDFAIARVIGRSLNFEKRDILLDKGFIDGIKEGMAVTVGKGVIIGKIIKTEAAISHVQLANDNDFKLAVFVAADESSLGVASGEHNLNIVINMLPKDIQIEIGDSVITSGLEEGIPDGLLLGTVAKVDNRSEKLWQRAVVRPAVDYNDILVVTIIK